MTGDLALFLACLGAGGRLGVWIPARSRSDDTYVLLGNVCVDLFTSQYGERAVFRMISSQVSIKGCQQCSSVGIYEGPFSGNCEPWSRTVRVCLSMGLDNSLSCLHNPSVFSKGLDGFGTRLTCQIDRKAFFP